MFKSQDLCLKDHDGSLMKASVFYNIKGIVSQEERFVFPSLPILNIKLHLCYNGSQIQADHEIAETIAEKLNQKFFCALHFETSVKYSKDCTLTIELKDELLDHSTVQKFKSNVTDRDLGLLEELNIRLDYYSSDFKSFTKLCNYFWMSLITSQLENRLPLIFNLHKRSQLANNLSYMGSISYTLTNTSDLMVKLLRSIINDEESFTIAMFQHLSNNKSKLRYRINKLNKLDEANESSLKLLN